MKVLTRTAILAVNDIKTEDVPTPEWGDKESCVRVRCITVVEADQWRAALMIEKPKRGLNAGTELVFDRVNAAPNEIKLIVMAAVDETGAPLFLADDVTALLQKSSAPVKRLLKAIMELSGLNPDAVDKAGND